MFGCSEQDMLRLCCPEVVIQSFIGLIILTEVEVFNWKSYQIQVVSSDLITLRNDQSLKLTRL